MLKVKSFFAPTFLSLLVLVLVGAAPARGEDRAPTELGIFEFDYDQRNPSPTVNLPAAPGEPGLSKADKAQPKAPTVAAPGGSAAAALGQAKPAAAPGRADVKNGVITIIGEPAPPGVQYDDYLPDYKAPEITLSPAGLPPTTRIPAKPGEARVEKSAPKSRPIARAAAASVVPESVEPTPPGSLYRFWQLAQVNWSRYGATSRAAQTAGLVGYTRTGVPVQDISQFGNSFR